MSLMDQEMELEQDWLTRVLTEVGAQLEEKQGYQDKYKKDAIETQRELWEEVGSVSISNELEQLADFMSFIGVMKKQKMDYEITGQQVKKYERMKESPYFARIDFREDGERNPESFYIGISNLIRASYEFLVYDWRAPVCGMFYDYGIGRVGYHCPGGLMEGELTLKRQYRIKNGTMEYAFDSDVAIDDEMLQGILGKSTDGRMKTIVTTIQQEQNRVIRNEEYQHLIVQGPAGCGKTSVALHRIAYLLYKHRDSITADNILVFSPNQVFNDYISTVLPELGEENMNQTTFMEYMHQALRGEGRLEDYAGMMEYILTSRHKSSYAVRTLSMKLKTSEEFIRILKRHGEEVIRQHSDFTDIVYKDQIIVDKEELTSLFFGDYAAYPLKRRLHKIRERILFLLEPHEKARIQEHVSRLDASGDYIDRVEVMEKSIALTRAEYGDQRQRIDRLTELDWLEIYKDLYHYLEKYAEELSIDIPKTELKLITDFTLENLNAGQLYYEDQPPLLYLKNILGEQVKTSEIKYVIIDEAQDYTPLQYEIFRLLFPQAKMTMLGDLNQSIHPYMNLGGYEKIVPLFPLGSSCLIHLTKSYRSTMEIAEFSRQLLENQNMADLEYVERRGEKPLVMGFSGRESLNSQILMDLHDFQQKGYRSIGIITRTRQEAEQAFTELKVHGELRAILSDSDLFRNDAVIIPAYLAKGLEFDVVLIYNAGEDNYGSEEERLLLYTAFTRALHVLRVYYTGECTKLIRV